jgi:hypothetical protein
MLVNRLLGSALALSLAAAAPIAAQDRGLIFFARGGGFNGLTSLDDQGVHDFKRVGFNVGGGLGLQFNRYLTLRGDFNFDRNELRTNDIRTGTKLNRYFYDAALQLQYPTTSGFEPYVFAGGGGVTLDQNGLGATETKGAGTFGLGLNYRIPGSPFGVFLEGKSWVFKPTGLAGSLAGFDRTQVDLAWSGGLSYKVRF